MRKKSKNIPNLKSPRPSLLLQITDLSRSGAGVGRDAQGLAIFVPFTAPGDHVRVKITKSTRHYAQAELLEILAPSPLRVEPVCPVFGQCGGCHWQHLPYDLQWQTKLNGVRHSLSAAKVTLPHTLEGFPAQQTFAYRNRVQLKGAGAELGFFAGKSHHLIPITTCAIAQPAINAALTEVRAAGGRLARPYSVELGLDQSGTVQQYWDRPHSAAGFRQINDEQNRRLQDWITTAIPAGHNILDLYGGTANLSQRFIESAREIHCVDSQWVDAEHGPTAPNLHFHRAEVLAWLQQRLSREIQTRPTQAAPDSVQSTGWAAIIDPPRFGLGDEGRDIIEKLERLGVTTVILVGCKTDPWSRDLSRFLQRQWRLKAIAVFDFFPQTFHVESTALLQRA